MKIREMENLIRNGMFYLTGDDKYLEEPISFDFVLEMRRHICKFFTLEDYQKQFPRAYQFDQGITREKGDYSYDTDGCVYTISSVDGECFLEECKLYKGDTVKVKRHIDCSLNYRQRRDGKCNYWYVNEPDHFFTNLIVYYLNDKESNPREKGILSMKEDLEMREASVRAS